MTKTPFALAGRLAVAAFSGREAAALRARLLDQMCPVRTMIEESSLGRLGGPEEVTEIMPFLFRGRGTFNTGTVFDLSRGRATD